MMMSTHMQRYTCRVPHSFLTRALLTTYSTNVGIKYLILPDLLEPLLYGP